VPARPRGGRGNEVRFSQSNRGKVREKLSAKWGKIQKPARGDTAPKKYFISGRAKPFHLIDQR
jgi:hypothetical protein